MSAANSAVVRRESSYVGEPVSPDLSGFLSQDLLLISTVDDLFDQAGVGKPPKNSFEELRLPPSSPPTSPPSTPPRPARSARYPLGVSPNVSPSKTSPSGATPNLHKLFAFATEIQETILKLPAPWMTTSRDEAVQPSDYFINPNSLFIKKGPDIAGPRENKFRKFFTEEKKHPEFQAIKADRKERTEQLVAMDEDDLFQNLIEVLLDHAQAGEPVEGLFLSSFIQSYPDEAARNKFTKAYNKIQKFSQAPTPSSLSEIVNFKEMTHDEACELLGFLRDKETKLNIDLWNSHREVLEKWILKHWDKMVFLPYAVAGKNLEPYPMIRLDLGESSIGFFRESRSLLEKEFDLTKQESTNLAKLLQQMFTLVEKLYQQAEYTRRDTLKKAISSFRSNCQEPPLNLFFQQAVKGIKSSELPIKATCIEALIREHKLHCRTRFYNLFEYYTAFANTIVSLEDQAKAKFGIKKEHVREIVLRILDKSDIEEDGAYQNQHAFVANAVASSSSGTHMELRSKDKQKKAKDEASVSFHYYREIMGREKDKLPANEQSWTIDAFNLFLGTHQNPKEKIDILQRAHTLPFPSCFGWKESFIQKTINEVRHPLEDTREFKPLKPVLFSAAFFENVRKERLSHTEIEDYFQSEFDHFETSVSADDYLYTCLLLVKHFYLRLFSETALLPDFINSEFDGLSEWREANSDQNYKKELAHSLKTLIKLGKPVSKKDTLSVLKSYLAVTQHRIDKKLNDLNKARDYTPRRQLDEILALQIKEAILLTSSRV